MYVRLEQGPDRVRARTETGWQVLSKDGDEQWSAAGVRVVAHSADPGLEVSIVSPSAALMFVQLRWQYRAPRGALYLGDTWERAYGDMEWRGLVPERVMPWYFLMHADGLTHGYGVKTGASALCSWQVDGAGISLLLDLRCGGAGVELGGRALQAATVVSRQGSADESAFVSDRALCRVLCDRPALPPQPVYGGNNWYYAEGNSSREGILGDTRRIASWAPAGPNRPYMVIDDGWQTHPRAGGPWDWANEGFGEMSTLVAEMRAHGVRAGIWFRPLLTRAPVPSTWILPRPRPSDAGDRVLDPSVPEVLDLVAADTRRLTQWGFELVKHDFTTHDLLGAWSNEMGTRITQGNWSFADRSRTTAEIVRAFYETIRDAAGTALVLGCNVIGHLSAGLFALQRTGDDTSGSVWERTRVMGVNTLAFRIAQHGTFFAADADCAAVTKAVPWHLAEQWLRLLAQSGTPLFVSASPAAIGPAQEAAIRAAFARAAFALAAEPRPVAEPLDWLQTTCPEQWSTADGITGFTWYDADGVETFR